MPTIGDLSHGFDINQVEAYIEQLRSIVLTQAAEEVQKIDEITAACEANWEGQARINFLESVKLDAQHVAEQYTTLFSILETEIRNLSAAMQNVDYNMIKIQGE